MKSMVELEDQNPYRAPDADNGRFETETDGISPIRFAVNVGGGLGALLLMASFLYISAINRFEGIALESVATFGLLSLGFAHSVWWAFRARAGAAERAPEPSGTSRARIHSSI